MIDEIIRRMRALESDHSPDGWPAVQMKDVSALCDENTRLKAEVKRLRESLAGARGAIDKILETEHDKVRAFVNELKAENKRLRERYETVLADSCDDDKFIKSLAVGTLTDYEINGDKYSVPGLQDVAELLVKRLRESNAKLRERAMYWIEAGGDVAHCGSTIIDLLNAAEKASK